MDTWMSKSPWHPERMIYQSICIVYAQSDKTLYPQNRCLKTCLWSSAQTTIQWQRLAPLQILIKIIYRNRTELWHRQQRTTGSHQSPRRMVTLTTRITTQSNIAIWSQEPGLLQAMKLNQWQTRWNVTLSQYNLKLVHVLGTKMVQSYALSQWPDLCLKEDNNNKNITLLPKQMFI